MLSLQPDLSWDACSVKGFPAHVGMDPVPDGPPVIVTRFPRTRGDGPLDVQWAHGMAPFPPHTWGWTLMRDNPGTYKMVSPAHVGMDPGRRKPCGRTGRFPRTRGDGPQQVFSGNYGEACPPHTRGWTHNGRAGPVRFRVSRAHGDGPYLVQLYGYSSSSPPHTWGWTLMSG